MPLRAASPSFTAGDKTRPAETPHDAVASRARLALGSVFTPTWMSSLLLAACFFLPLVRGCGENVVYPYEMYDDLHTPADFFGVQVYTWSYCFGLLTAAGVLLLVLSRNPLHYRSVWWGYALLIVATTIGIWFAVGKELQGDGEQAAANEIFSEYLWILAPTAILTAAVVVTYFNCRTWFAAALWLRLFLAVLATIWFALFLGDLLLGGRLSLAACIVLVFATLSERASGLRTLGVDPGKLRRSRGQRLASVPRRLPRWLSVALALLPILAALACIPFVLSADPPAAPPSSGQGAVNVQASPPGSEK